MEPLLLDQVTPELADTAAAIIQAVGAVGGRLPSKTLASLADLVRLMNCYYSNLIEGHRTRPRDIEAALRSGGTQTTSKIPGNPKGERLLKLALAHIACQTWIEDLYAKGALPDPASSEFICEVHKRFYQDLPLEFREIRDEKTHEIRRIMEPGRIRSADEEVSVGEHIPPSGGAPVAAFLAAYSDRYRSLRSSTLGLVQRLLGIATAHHRLLYIHPFDDGNGRVARLVTHAMMLDAGLGAYGIWSMSRGLARGLRKNAPRLPPMLRDFAGRPEPDQYKLMMAYADSPRQGDLDGRGNLSRKRLQEFCDWFLSVALDQLTFMSSQFQLDKIEEGLEKYYVPRRHLDQRAAKVLAEVARLGSIERSSVRTLLNISGRTATNLIASLLKDGILASDNLRDSLRLHFSPDSAEILFPSLFSVEALIESPDDQQDNIVVASSG